MSAGSLATTRTTSVGSWPVETRVFAVVAVLTLAALPLGLAELDVGGQLLLVAVPALLLGLPHGALDAAVARELGLWHDRRGWLRFHLVYVSLAAATVGAFVVAPVASLVAFLVTSAWHFSGDLRDVAGPWVRAGTGAGLVSLPAVARPEQVGELYALIAGPGAVTIAEVQSRAGPALLVVVAIAVAVLWRRDPRAGVEAVLTAALALAAPPLVFFAVYFVALHSPRHLAEAVAAVGSARSAVAPTLLAVVGLAIAGLFLVPSVGTEAAIATTVFVGLAALTAPHMLLVERAQRRDVLAGQHRSS